ncbi:MAG: hypothetical protein N4A61_12010 [Pelagimonas sp.]|nr:hypothetical protein [Pelagimonas sp.]
MTRAALRRIADLLLVADGLRRFHRMCWAGALMGAILTMVGGAGLAHDRSDTMGDHAEIAAMVDQILSTPQKRSLETPDSWDLEGVIDAFDWPRGTDREFLAQVLDIFGLYVRGAVVDGQLRDPFAIYDTDYLPVAHDVEALAPQADRMLRWYEGVKTCCD